MAIQRITSGIIADGAIVATDIGDGVVTASKIADANVTSSKLASSLTISANTGSAAAPSIFPTGDTNTGIFFPAADTIAFAEGGAEAMRIDANGRVGIGTTSPSTNPMVTIRQTVDDSDGGLFLRSADGTAGGAVSVLNNGSTVFRNGGAERVRIDSSGNLLVKTTTVDITDVGCELRASGVAGFTVNQDVCLTVNRLGNDGNLVDFRQDTTVEGSISVSGSTVTYGGGHLARWGQLLDGSKDESLKKGTVLSNLDEMCVWSAPTTYWTEEDELPVDENGNQTVAVGDVKKEAFTADNEQCNKIKVSDVEGDANVAGVFVSWTYDEQFNSNDLFVAMTGDMIIRIAQGTTVARGDLLMSAGDGTAKPQGDDIVRSKTIAKVTSTHVTCTYDDGSYCVPCVLMAC